jgi:4-hydroxy-3-methylbut-2-enyl diphosphate reductase
VETHLIETAAELKEDWFKGKRHLGITSGTSTPEETIQEIIQRIEAML